MFSTCLVVSALERAHRKTWLPEKAMGSVLRAGCGRLQLPSRPRAQGAQPPAGAQPRPAGRPCQCGVLCGESWARAVHAVLSSACACPRGVLVAVIIHEQRSIFAAPQSHALQQVACRLII